jgi:hypothetical protein
VAMRIGKHSNSLGWSLGSQLGSQDLFDF